jgi:hypothetical protein
VNNDDSWSIPAPAFKPDEVLVQVKRALRDMKLAERGNAYELKGKRVVELSLDRASIAVKIARRLMLTPEWDRLTIDSSAAQRKVVDEVKKRLARWETEE